jgi:hypothetical protein
MTATFDLPPRVEQAYRDMATAKGVPVEDLVRDAVIASQPTAFLDAMTPEDPDEWVREFRAWVASNDEDDLPLLSDEAISREFIYRERGL